MKSPGAKRRGQFQLWELFVALTVAAVWSAAGHYLGWIWVPITLFFVGPALYFLGQRWSVYFLELLGVLVTLTSPLWILFALGVMSSFFSRG